MEAQSQRLVEGLDVIIGILVLFLGIILLIASRF